MKEIIAVIRINKMNETKRALADAGISSLTARDAVGRGSGVVDINILEGAEKGYEEAIALLGKKHRLRPKRVLYVVVPDKLKDKTVKTIIEANQDAKSGCGKIFVLPTNDAVRVRTGEESDIVLDEG